MDMGTQDLDPGLLIQMQVEAGAGNGVPPLELYRLELEDLTTDKVNPALNGVRNRATAVDPAQLPTVQIH
jgi:hypothetical protein